MRWGACDQVASTESSRARVLVSHPHAAFVSQAAAAGLARRSALGVYFVGLGLAEKALSERTVRLLLTLAPRMGNRVVPAVDQRRLVSLVLPELWARLGGRLRPRGPMHAVSWYHAMFFLHDLLVAQVPWPPDLGTVYAYEDAALRTFERAAHRRLRRVLDLPSVHYRTIERVLCGEMERYPDAQPGCRAREPAWKKRRKDGELAAANEAVVASAFTKRSLLDAPRHPSAIHVVPYGFPVRSFRPRPGRPEGPFTVLAVGTQRLLKGTHHLLEAWRRAGLKNARLRLVGSMQLAPAFLSRYEGAFEHVPSMPRAALEREYHAADLLAFPTLGDGFGLVIQEAMCCGVPVVTTRCGGGPECIDDGSTGFLVPARDPDALASVIARAAARRDDLVEMGRAARRCAERYPLRRAADALASTILGRRGPAGLTRPRQSAFLLAPRARLEHHEQGWGR